MNWKLGPKTRGKLRRHWAIFNVLWKNFVRVAERCIVGGGEVAFEWPRGCSYWRLRKVKSFLKRHKMFTVALDGCMYNLRSQHGKRPGALMRKPWLVASTAESFAGLEARCNHQSADHVRVEGMDTRLSEGYTDELVDCIHTCWQCHCNPTRTSST